MSFDFTRLYPYDDEQAARAIYEIWLTHQGSGCPVMEFAASLRATRPGVYRRLRKLLEKTADEGKLKNPEMYKNIGDDIWEFKAHTARIYSFTDGRRVVLTHGGEHVKRAADERKKAGKVRTEYTEWKKRRPK